MSKNSKNFHFPVFIMGCERSGTTFLGSLIGAHSQCIVTPESQFKVTVRPVVRNGMFDARRTYGDIVKTWHFQKWECGDLLKKDELDRINDYSELLMTIVAKYGEQILGKMGKGFHWIDHTPNNLENMEWLLSLYPDAKFIHIVRDGRGVYSSLKRVNWGPDTVLEASTHWLKKLALGFVLQYRYPDRVYTIKYEDILKDPEGSTKCLCSFLGIGYEERMLLADGMHVPSYTRHQHEKVGQKPDPSKIYQWKKDLTRREREIFEYEAGNVLSTLEYERVFKNPRKISKTEKFIYFAKKRLIRIRKEICKIGRKRNRRIYGNQ